MEGAQPLVKFGREVGFRYIAPSAVGCDDELHLMYYMR